MSNLYLTEFGVRVELLSVENDVATMRRQHDGKIITSKFSTLIEFKAATEADLPREIFPRNVKWREQSSTRRRKGVSSLENKCKITSPEFELGRIVPSELDSLVAQGGKVANAFATLEKTLEAEGFKFVGGNWAFNTPKGILTIPVGTGVHAGR
jgi:hypothetical protein